MAQQKPLKILQMVSGTVVNGALTHCRLLSGELAKRGHDVTIACRQGSWIWSQADDSSLRLVTCPMKRWPISKVRRFADWVTRESFDVIHTHMSSANLFGVLLKHLTGIPVVATAHCRHVQPHWYFNDLVLANSQATIDFQKRFNRVPDRRIELVPCFIDPRFFNRNVAAHAALRRQWRFPADAQVIVIAGDVCNHKGHWYLFQALPKLCEQFPRLRVVVVGRFHRRENYCRRLREFQLANQLAKRVKWIGLRDNMPEVLSAADIVVQPSLVEAQGMIALESMAIGTAVIGSATGGLKDSIQDGWNGILVPTRNSASLFQAAKRLLGDNEQRKQICENGQTFAQDFSLDSTVSRIEQAFFRVLKHTRLAAA